MTHVAVNNNISTHVSTNIVIKREGYRCKAGYIAIKVIMYTYIL